MWTDADPNDPARFTSSDNEKRTQKWWYLSAAGFASGYAQTNPGEDFGESFAACLSQRAGWTFDNGTGASDCGPKVALINTWLSKL